MKRKRGVRERKVDLASRPPVIKIGDKNIGFKNLIMYLDVWFDQEMGVKTHCKKLGEKVNTFCELR